MSLLEQWRNEAYSTAKSRDELKAFWNHYFEIEQGIYKKLLANPEEEVKGTVKELAERFHVSVMHMVGFLDGIEESLVKGNDIENIDLQEETPVSLNFDNRMLYMNMVDAKADWLFNLPEWEKIFTEEERKVLYKEQKNAGTIRKPKKIGRNDPCPCGSGKKYKHCCGRK